MTGSANAGSGGMSTPDFLIIGGGVIGLTLARELKSRRPGADIVVIEKENACGQHASGRNSGVLHAGFYYTADSLKARFSREGNLQMQEYCRERGLRLNACGKLVVARDEDDLPGLDELARRGEVNGVPLDEITEAEARELEPRVRTFERALFSPSTAAVDPGEVMAALERDVRRAGVEIFTSEAFVSADGESVRTTRRTISAGFVINAAGLYADKIARWFGFSQSYRILPFKGLYAYDRSGQGPIRRHVYPVPELRYPFLGVHFTVTALGTVKIGPTAIPSVWREQYGGMSNFRLAELLEIGSLEAGLFTTNAFDFRTLAFREMKKYSRRNLVRMAGELVRDVAPAPEWSWGRPGIRAQLVDVNEGRLVMDFVVESDEKSLHVLNAVSPAFTCSMPFAAWLANQIENGTAGRQAARAS